ncbi:hypothetical protein OIU85_007185 [Salix viminalis]|uniref:Uncharacterized protein n=1 Tax=Salix viminalis TaxID=40686 RepID=A0A9Q0P8B2_SALVM|nr:hypothetical protein OIU85_007185 [Salix viminalis]
MCGCGQSDHQFTADHMIDEYNDGSFDQLFERHRQKTDDTGETFTLVEKEIVKELLWLRINGATRESSKSRSTSHPNAQVTRSYGKLPVIPKKKRSRGGDLGFLYPRKRRSSHDDDYEEEEEVEEAKALIGEDGDKDFKLRIRKKLFQTDTNAHHDRFTMPCLQINEAENLLVDAQKTTICHGDGIGVTLVELGLGDERDSTLTSQLRVKQWIYSFRRNGELWIILVKDSDHEEGRKDAVFGRRTLMD